jgi:hypothetical protein
MEESMNIYALPGYQVKVTEKTKDNGYDCDAAQVKRLLEIEKVYTVACTRVFGSTTDVMLEGFPDGSFNSVNFVGITVQTEEEDKQHRYWHIYNRE